MQEYLTTIGIEGTLLVVYCTPNLPLKSPFYRHLLMFYHSKRNSIKLKIYGDSYIHQQNLDGVRTVH